MTSVWIGGLVTLRVAVLPAIRKGKQQSVDSVNFLSMFSATIFVLGRPKNGDRRYDVHLH